jgi:hypothetical protein
MGRVLDLHLSEACVAEATTVCGLVLISHPKLFDQVEVVACCAVLVVVATENVDRILKDIDLGPRCDYDLIYVTLTVVFSVAAKYSEKFTAAAKFYSFG